MPCKAIDAKNFMIAASSLPQDCIRASGYSAVKMDRVDNIQFVQLNWREKLTDYPDDILRIRDAGVPKAKKMRLKIGKY